MHSLFHFKSKLELLLKSKLELELLRVIKAKLLAGVVEDAAYYMR